MNKSLIILYAFLSTSVYAGERETPQFTYALLTFDEKLTLLKKEKKLIRAAAKNERYTLERDDKSKRRGSIEDIQRFQEKARQIDEMKNDTIALINREIENIKSEIEELERSQKKSYPTIDIPGKAFSPSSSTPSELQKKKNSLSSLSRTNLLETLTPEEIEKIRKKQEKFDRENPDEVSQKLPDTVAGKTSCSEEELRKIFNKYHELDTEDQEEPKNELEKEAPTDPTDRDFRKKTSSTV